MQNPLEKFLLNLAEKIQTEKEYKDIVNNSQTVDVNKNVFEGFIAGVAETIKKELKERATVVPVSAVEIVPEPKPEEDSFVKFVSTLASTISAKKNKPTEENEETRKREKQDKKQDEPVPVPVETKQEPAPEPDSFQTFMGNLKDILQKSPQQKPVKIKKKQPVKEKNTNKIEDKVVDYVSELKRDENEERVETKEDSIKNLVRRFVENEIKNFKDEVGVKIGQMGSSYGGGGNNSYNYYPDGGPMYGNLLFPSSGTGIVFADGTTLTSTAGLTASGGGGGNPAVNALVISNSASWNSTYTTVNTYSGTWSTGLQDLTFDENTALLGITNGNTVSLSALSSIGGGGGDPAVNTVVYNNSANRNNNYSTTSYFSAFWNAAVDEIFTFYVTQTSAASAFWTEDGNYYFIQNSKLDNWQLWNSMYTTLFLTSGRWESTRTTVNQNSARWENAYISANSLSASTVSVYTTFNQNSSKYESVYSTYNSNSASYATETLAIAYAVAL